MDRLADDHAGYKTRILVRRPTNPAHFNGTVLVEWMNVSAGESAPDWDFLNPMLMRDGYAYVGVSAQALGVDGGKSLLGTPGRRAPTGGWSGTSRRGTGRCTTPVTSTPWTCTPRSARPCTPRTTRRWAVSSQARPCDR